MGQGMENRYMGLKATTNYILDIIPGEMEVMEIIYNWENRVLAEVKVISGIGQPTRKRAEANQSMMDGFPMVSKNWSLLQPDIEAWDGRTGECIADNSACGNASHPDHPQKFIVINNGRKKRPATKHQAWRNSLWSTGIEDAAVSRGWVNTYGEETKGSKYIEIDERRALQMRSTGDMFNYYHKNILIWKFSGMHICHLVMTLIWNAEGLWIVYKYVECLYIESSGFNKADKDTGI